MGKIKNNSHGRKRNPIKSSVIILIPILLLLLGGTFAFGAVNQEPNKQVLEKAFKIQIPFVENKGQISDEHVRFYSKLFGGTVYLTDKGEMVYSLIKSEPSSSPALGKRHRRNETITKTWSLKEELIGASINPPQGIDKTQTKVNYFIGNEKDKWKTDLTTYNTVNLGEVYKGIDLSLKAYGKNVEKIFTVNPGADPKTINLKIEGANSLNINDKGELEVETELGPVSFAKPIAYQEINGKRVEINVGYELFNSKPETRNSQLAYGFKVANYDKSRPLIIDPLLASTFLGGASNDYGNAIAIDGSGNVFVTGYTNSSSFPKTTGDGYVGGEDVFVSKFDSNLSTLLASTFLGGTSNERAWTMAIDGSGNVYVSGWTSSTNYPVTASAYQKSNAGGFSDVFISKLSNNLNQLMASTYLGGDNTDDVGGSLAIDSSGNVYVIGDTLSSNFPVTTGIPHKADYDAFVSKFDSNLSSLLASTLIGGDGTDDGNGIAILNFLAVGEFVYVVGSTSSTNFPAPFPLPPLENNGYFDAFVAMFKSDDLTLLASKLLGGTGWEAAFSIAISRDGIFVGGYTTSSDFPTTSGAYDRSYNGGKFDSFVAKFDANLSLKASTFIGGGISGGDMDEFIMPIAIDNIGNVFVAGYTRANDFPTTTGAFDTTWNGGYDAFVAKLNKNLTQLLASTFLGGSGDDDAYGLAFDPAGNVLIVGSTTSLDFPITSNAPYKTHSGNSDAFVAKLDPNLSGVDSDGDGLPDDWEMTYFGSLDYGPNDDPDGDGYSNAREFALGTNPNDPGSIPAGYVPDAERNALIALYNSTNGDNWTNKTDWLSPTVGECYWYGVFCTDNHVTIIDLDNNNLSGTIPSLSSLTELVELYLDHNSLSGNIPSLDSLTKLKILYLHNNQLSGSIPSLNSLTSLMYLNLSNNQLTGGIPWLENLTNLVALYLEYNQLSGSIPWLLSNLTNLQALYLDHNQLSGNIPSLIKLTSLQDLMLDHNQLTGSIPLDIVSLTNLKRLYLFDNRLSGTIPPAIGNLANLEVILLNGNMLSGPIPASITNLTKLTGGGSDFRWNALYTTDETIRNFLNSKQNGGNWEGTQTITPTSMTVTELSDTSVQLSWTPIAYTGDSGGYEVYYTSGGPYTLYTTTATKSAATAIVNGLTPGTQYFFTVRTKTNPHASNQNTVYSEYTTEGGGTTGLVGWWKFDECSGTAVSDSSGLGNDGTLFGTVSFTTDALLGCGLDFTALDDAVIVPHNPTLEPATGTIQTWLKVDILQNADIVVKVTYRAVRSGIDNPGGYAVFGIRTTADGKALGYIMNDDPPEDNPEAFWVAVYSPPNSIIPGKWHHLALRWDGSAVAFFLDGVLKDSAPYVPVPGIGLSYYNGSPLYFGAETYGMPAFVGKLDDVRFYGRALTDDEIYNTFLLRGLPDTDLDGLDDAWEMANFGTLAYGPNDDPDNDGFTNLQEYLSGTNPNEASNPFTITANYGSDGVITEMGKTTPIGTVTVNYLGSVALSITPKTGYHVANVWVDSNEIGPATTYSFNYVTSDHTISATFASDTSESHTIIASSDTCGSISPLGTISVPYGGSQAFTISAEEGCIIIDVLVDGLSQGAITTYTFSQVTENHTIEAKFGSGDPATGTTTPPDSDKDGIPDHLDNCPNVKNASQANADGDRYGDACDNCPTVANDDQVIPIWYRDADNDGYSNGQTLQQCSRPAGYKLPSELTSISGDTDDNNPEINPGVTGPQVIVFQMQNYDTWLPTDGASVTINVSVSGGTLNSLEVVNVTNWPGKYTNDPNTDNSPDFLCNGTPCAVGMVLSGNSFTLTSLDYGASITIRATATVNGSPVQKDFRLPKDTIGLGLPDYWQTSNGLVLGHALTDDPDGDGLTNLEELRGFRWGTLKKVEPNASENLYQTTAFVFDEIKHFRTNPKRKDLFVKYSNYSAENPFAIGKAFDEAGIDVHAVDVSAGLSENNIGVVRVNNELTLIYSDTNTGLDSPGHAEAHIAHRTGKIRDWEWATKGFSMIGNATSYGSGTTTYQRALDNYFNEKPYTNGNTCTSTICYGSTTSWTVPNNILDPIDRVEDRNDDGYNTLSSGKYDTGCSNCPWHSDVWVRGSFVQALSPFNPLNITDDNGKPMVELPVGNPNNRYTKAQVLKHTITHELGHAVGLNHNYDSTCIMYIYSNDWSRDGNFSEYAKGLIRIHNP